MLRIVAIAFLAVLPWSSRAGLPDFQPIVESAAPAVVKILVESEQQAMPGADELEQLPEYLRRFFEFRGGPPQRQQRNMGSGFIVSEDGYIAIEVKDNGGGLAKNIQPETHNSLSSTIIKERMELFNQSLKNKIQLVLGEIKNEKGEIAGTKVELKVPFSYI